MKPETRRQLEKKLDKVFSIYVRKSNNGICITCGRQQDWKLTDCGHYIKRNVKRFRWEIMNTGCQCKKCNNWGEGEKDIFRRKLIEKYGSQKIEIMEAERFKPFKWSLSDLKLMILDYDKKIKEGV